MKQYCSCARAAFLVLAIAAGIVTDSALGAAPGSAGTSDDAYDAGRALGISQDAVGGTLSDARFIDANGGAVNLARYRGKPLVISLIYTSCHQVCPMTTQQLGVLVNKAQQVFGADTFNVISVGFDTAHDTPDAMGRFAAQQGIDHPNWRFLSGTKAAVDAVARETGFIYFPSPRGFDHLIQATIVDANGKVYRQVYGEAMTPQFIEPLKELIYGAPMQKSLISEVGNRIRLFCTVYDPVRDSYVVDYSIFIGMFIGLTSLLIAVYMVVREWRRVE